MMVGSAKPAACHTCRRRRVKCDQNQPSCERCLKAKIPCAGYEKDLKFVDEKGRAQQKVKSRREAYLQAVDAEDRRKDTRQDRDGGLAGPDLSLTGFQDKTEISFTLSKLLTGSKMFIPWAASNYTGQDSCTTTQTINALSGVYFGKMHSDAHSLESGVKHYTKALGLLGADLKNPEVTYQLPSLTNILSLCLCEMMISSEGMGVIHHQEGVGKLIQGFQPERFQTQPELSVFESCRLSCLYACLETRKRCFLEESDWRELPWVKCPEAKDALSRLYDHLSFVPGMLESMETMRGNHAPAQALDLSSQTLFRLQELYSWRATWELQNPQCSSEVAASNSETLFPTVLYYTSLLRMVENSLYNVNLLLLFRIGRMLLGPDFYPAGSIPSSSLPRNNPALASPYEHKTVQQIAREILRSAEYAMLEPHQSGGCFQLLFPLRVAMEVFREGDAEWTYLGTLFTDIAEKGGFEIAKGLMPKGLCGRLLEDVNLV